MWSKQADTRNKNATSLKNKITNRKRKTSKTRNNANDAQQVDNNVTPSPAKDNKSGKKGKNRKSRKDQAKHSDTKPDLIEDLKQGDNAIADVIINGDVSKNAKVEADINHRLEITDVLLRNGCKKSGASDTVDGELNGYNNNLKRYSDSFVLDDIRSDCQPRLSRAVSGYILTDAENCDFIKEDNKVERKSRRFSDLFRYGTLKSCNSCDNLEITSKMIKSLDETDRKLNDEFEGVILRRTHEKSASDGSKSIKPNKKINGANKMFGDSKSTEKTKKEEVPLTNTNSSYLKRVKSKIYKNRNSENITSTLPSMPDISETVKTKKNKNKKNAEIKSKAGDVVASSEATSEVRRSMPHFDFRLIRQTSNLERIRPRTFGVKKSSSNTGISELENNNANLSALEKPVLAKSKSSSAINLNLLRARRNKIMEQVKSRNCQVVQNEFDFIPFGRNSGINRKFGSQNLYPLINNVSEVLKENTRLEASEGKHYSQINISVLVHNT